MNFYDSFERLSDRTAFISDQGYEISYKSLAEKCMELWQHFETGKNLVFCFCRNEVPSVVGYLSCLQSRNVPLLLNADIDNNLAAQLINTYHPQYLYNANAEILNGFEYERIYDCDQYTLVKLNNAPIKINEELALLLTTSGSTGSPKLVRQSYANIQANAESIAKYLELDENERPITTLPMNYTYGLSIINSHLLVGAGIILTDFSLVQNEFWDLCKEKKATSFGGVPYTYEMLKKLRFFGMDLPYLKTMTQAGGKLRPELHKEFAEYALEKDKKFIVMYGQTEATARMAYLPHEKALEKYGSMGIAIPGGKLWLKDENCNEITDSEVVGELIYEGANVTLGYAECEDDLEKGDDLKGVLETGDMAKKDQEGFFYIVGRKKRFLKIFGNRVNLDEIEAMLKKQFEISELVCAGVDDRLYVFIEENNETSPESMKRYLTETTKLNLSAYVIKTIPQIPKNDAGKVMYRMLENYYD